MANNYLQYSEVLGGLTEEETNWFTEQTELGHVRFESTYDGNIVTGIKLVGPFEKEIPEGSMEDFIEDLPRFIYDHWEAVQQEMDLTCVSFDGGLHGIEIVPDGKGKYDIYFVCEESGDPWIVGFLVQMYLRKFHPDGYFTLSYAVTCSKMRVGEFGGGAMFVSADSIENLSAHQWLGEQVNKHRDEHQNTGAKTQSEEKT